MFLPTTPRELRDLNWDQLDIILVSGDTYIDSPNDGIAVIGKVLHNAGWKVGIIAQPDIKTSDDITRLGEPRLFWGVSAGCVDSMVANYTALMKKKHSDDLTPGDDNNRRPDRATIAYTNLIQRSFKNKKPIVLGGIEAGLRRIAHYDYWSDNVRRSVLFDAKADILVYGMGERAVVEIASALDSGTDYKRIRGICYKSPAPVDGYLELPSYEVVKNDKELFTEMFNIFYQNTDALSATGLMQKHDNRYLVQNPPALPLEQEELDEVYNLQYERDVHPYYKKLGVVKALDTIRFSITSHRGCFGECNFCSITAHQGRRVVSRSESSIIAEATLISKMKGFKGYITDVGGPSANMYGMECKRLNTIGGCPDKRCIFPDVCRAMNISHDPQTQLLDKLRKIPGVKKVFIGSGIRYDIVIADKQHGYRYIEDIIEHHVSGQMKIAPEHISGEVLTQMGKPSNNRLIDFKDTFDRINKKIGKKQFLTYYFIAAHPGCSQSGMHELKDFIKHELRLNPEQVQVFTPTPSTISTLIYYTGKDPQTGENVFVERDLKKKREQKETVFR